MALSYPNATNWVRFADPQTGVDYFRVVNVTSWEENPLRFQGESERTYNGRLISNEREGRWSASAVLEFPDGAQLGEFESFIYGARYSPMVRGNTLRPVIMWPSANTPGFHNGIFVWVRLGARRPFEAIASNTLTVSWSVDVTIEEYLP